MKLIRIYFFLTLIFMSVLSCTSEKPLSVKVIETSKNGNKLSQITSFTMANEVSSISINPEITYQKITGFGGSFTEASAHLLNKLSSKNRESILNAYFSKEGANYSLTSPKVTVTSVPGASQPQIGFACFCWRTM